MKYSNKIIIVDLIFNYILRLGEAGNNWSGTGVTTFCHLESVAVF